MTTPSSDSPALRVLWTRDDRLFAWGDRGPGRGGGGRRYPGALPGSELRPRLHRAAGGAYVTRWSPETRVLALPGPGDSPPRDVEVPGYSLDPLASADLLFHPPDSGWGGDLAWLAGLADFAEDLVRRGRYLPRLREVGGRYRSAWVARVDQEADLARRAAMRDAAPRSLLAERPAAARAGRKRLVPSARPFDADGLVDRVLDRAVDLLIRPVLRDEGGAAARAAGGEDAGLAGRFVDSLVDLEPRVDGSPAGLAALAAALDAWAGAPATHAAVPYQLGLRLGEPATEDGAWGLTGFVRSEVEPSLRYPVREVLDPGVEVERELGRFAAPLQDMVGAKLRALAAAFPPLARWRDRAAPDTLDLDAAQAHAFLRDAAARIGAEGVALELPSWWNGARARLGLTVKAWPPDMVINPADRPLEARKLARFTWKLALDGEGLTPKEVARLAAAKRPLVRLRGRWVEVEPAALAAAEDLAAGGYRAGQDAAVLEVLGAAAGRIPPPWELPVTGLDPAGPLAELLRGEGPAAPKAVAEPPGFQARLRPYQARGVAWLETMGRLGLGACLADDMGLGKTVQVLALLARRRAAGETGPTLLVAPTSVLTSWRDEAARFVPALRVLVHHGPGRPKGRALAGAVGGADLVVTSYALLARDRPALAGVAWTRVVLDEAQAIKNPATRAARAARALPAGSRVALTGTPIENRLADLWALFHFLEPGLFGSRRRFRGRFAVPVERHGDPVATDLLRRTLAPFVLRRRKDVALPDLPEKTEGRVFCPLTREQVGLYQAVLDEMMAALGEREGLARRGQILATLTKLRQVCNHPAHLTKDAGGLAGRSGKLARLDELLDAARDAGEPALVFTQYREMGEILRRYLGARCGRPPPFLHGGVPRPKRDEMVAAFQATDGPPVMLLSLKAGGTGLTLTRATQVIHYDRWWNPAVEDQATDRAHRIGQDRPVTVHKLVCRGTLEERLDALLRRKRGLSTRALGAVGETWITELPDRELRELLALSGPEAP